MVSKRVTNGTTALISQEQERAMPFRYSNLYYLN